MSAAAEPLQEALEAWHEGRGAVWREVRGRRLVARYGAGAGEAEALAEGCGLVEWRWVDSLTVSGADRHRFLNAYLTCDVGALAPGAGTYGFFTSPQGRVLADAVVSAGDDALRLDVPGERAAALVDHLRRYVLADRVAVERDAAAVHWLLLGPLAPTVAARWLPDLPAEPWASTTGRVAGLEVAARRERNFGQPVFSLRTAAPEASTVAEELAALGCRPVGFDAVETVRVEAGVPRFGIDFDEENFPQEVGFEEAVSYTKGCYLGQEVVARIHYRGHVNHQLRLLRIDGSEAPAPGATLEVDGEEVGRLGSVARASRGGGLVALAMIHRKAAAAGTEVSLPNGLTARVERPASAPGDA